MYDHNRKGNGNNLGEGRKITVIMSLSKWGGMRSNVILEQRLLGHGKKRHTTMYW